MLRGVKYQLVDNGETIFIGDQYNPSPCYPPTARESALMLLGFLTLRPGDTDDEYFNKHSTRQLEWLLGDTAEELRMANYDFENALEDELNGR